VRQDLRGRAKHHQAAAKFYGNWAEVADQDCCGLRPARPTLTLEAKIGDYAGQKGNELKVHVKATHKCGIRSYFLRIRLTNRSNKAEQWLTVVPKDSKDGIFQCDPKTGGRDLDLFFEWAPYARHKLPVDSLAGWEVSLRLVVESCCNTQATEEKTLKVYF